MIVENVAKCLMVHKKKTQAVSPNFVYEGNCIDKRTTKKDAQSLFGDFRVARCWVGPKGSDTTPKILSNNHSDFVQNVLKSRKKTENLGDSENILFDEKHYVHDSGTT